MSEQIRIHAVVSGRVQGVYYRASTRERALEIGVTGWVRNRADGSVELEAQGSPEQVENLLAWARQGPEQARVQSCVPREIPTVPGEQHFQITQ
ncbi:MAG: acylphosphatase [Pseudomonadota bacterium]|nr:acylphosphatase [Pseudomonadota bacterium]